MNWREVCQNPDLQNLPHKIELNRQGQIVMSPGSVTRTILRARIIALLNQLCPDSLVVPEFPIETDDGVKVVDVGLLEMSQIASLKNNVTSAVAPKICIEVLSPSNTLAEMKHKKALYFEKGAEEFWLCEQLGSLSFYDRNGELRSSQLAVGFPDQIDL